LIFFVKDWVDSGDIRVTYCPTKDMVADFFTKPLQGSTFIHFQNFLLNVDSLVNATKNLRSVLGNDASHEGTTTTNVSMTNIKDDIANMKKISSGNLEDPWVLVTRDQVNRKCHSTEA